MGSTPTPGFLIVRKEPSWFRVIEINKDGVPVTEARYGEGDHWAVLLKKENYNTQHALDILRRRFGGRWTYAGSKDKFAITFQEVRARGCTPRDWSNAGIEIKVLGRAVGPLRLGDLGGNRFEIRYEGQVKEPPTKIPNFFGPQRFGRERKNPAIGKALILNRFEDAVEMLAGALPRRYVARVQEYLNKQPRDWAGALSRIPRNLLLLFVHSYQALLFNWYLAEHGGEKVWVPGYKMRVDEHWRKIFKEENISADVFKCYGLPQLRSPGHLRQGWLRPRIELGGGWIRFDLPPGAFASVVLGFMGAYDAHAQLDLAGFVKQPWFSIEKGF